MIYATMEIVIVTYGPSRVELPTFHTLPTQHHTFWPKPLLFFNSTPVNLSTLSILTTNAVKIVRHPPIVRC